MSEIDEVLKRIVKQLERGEKVISLTQAENDALCAKFPSHDADGLFHSPRLTRAGARVQSDGRP